MVELSISGDTVTFEMQGVHRLWCLRRRIDVPLRNIRSVRPDPDAARGWWRGFKAPGTHVPGLITAGSFYQNGEWSFWDVCNREGVIVVELTNERFVRLVVEVSDPAEAVSRLQARLRRHAA